MKGNLEHLSQSKNITLVEPLAQPFRALIPVNKEKLVDQFNIYWKDNFTKIIKALPENIDKEKLRNDAEYKADVERLVGYGNLYMEVINKLANRNLDNVLVYETLDLLDFESENPSILAIFYYIPKLTLSDSINYEVEHLSPIDYDIIWEARLDDLKQKHRQLYTPDTKSIPENETCKLLVTLKSYKDGVIYKNDWVNDEWIDIDDLPYPVRKIIYGKPYDTPFHVTYSNKHNSVINATLVIKDVQIAKDVTDEELSKKEGFASILAMKTSFIEEIKEAAETEKLAHMCDVLMSKMVSTATIDPIPFVWLQTTAKKMKDQYINSVGNLSKALSTLGFDNEVDLDKAFIAEAHRDLLKKITFSAYAEKFGLNNENEILDHLLKNVKWKDHGTETS